MKLKILATGSKGNAYLLWVDDKCVLLDAGVQFARIKEAVGYDLSRIEFALTGHRHLDHFKAVPELIDAGIHVIVPPLDGWEEMAGSYDCSSIGDWTIKHWDIEHDVKNWAFLLYNKKTDTKICYFSDTSHSPLIPICDTLIAEVSYCDSILDSKKGELDDRYLRLRKYHMGLNRFKAFLAEMMHTDGYRLKNIIITHLSDSNSDEEQIRREVKELTGIEPYMAKKGLTVEL